MYKSGDYGEGKVFVPSGVPRKGEFPALERLMNMITGKDLIEIGYPQGKVIGLALEAVPYLKHDPVQDLPLQYFRNVLENPERYLDDPHLGETAKELVKMNAPVEDPQKDLYKENTWGYYVAGRELIDENTHEQMRDAMRLPVTRGGALMPDAHLGYGLPVGGVYAAENAVIPWAVGVDIACRMRLSIFDLSDIVIGQKKAQLREILLRNTNFGPGGSFKEGRRGMDHEVLEDPAFDSTQFLRGLKDQAYAQLGTSGSGNHFVEWGAYQEVDKDSGVPFLKGKLAILSHSGSRGVGFKIAQRYSKIAQKKTPLPDPVKEMSWLPMDSEEGMEYWLAMELAGRFAAANHEVIHKKMAKALGAEPVDVIENHHNFAWREDVNGREMLVHRKGATPAGKDVMGVIPGTMGDGGYVVKGLGNKLSLNSASHGAGRRMSRGEAKRTISEEDWKKYLEDNGIELLGGGIDEAPQAYKSIDEVMPHQQDLVEVVGKFTPKIVRMDDGKKGR